MLWPHRTTGEPILAVWEQQTDALLPLEPEESDALLERLFEHLYRPEHQYVHEWAPNDLVLWDNHALQHSRPAVGVRAATVAAPRLRGRRPGPVAVRHPESSQGERVTNEEAAAAAYETFRSPGSGHEATIAVPR